MAFLTAPVRVRVPASSANLGPGFDSLGLALTLYDDVTARVTGGGVRVTVRGEGADDLPTDGSHLIVSTMNAAFDRLGGRPDGIELLCENHIPHARGLGSSSAAVVAGILLARALVEQGSALLDDFAVMRLAAEIEGHPDNVAPTLLGGFTIAWTTRPARGHGGTRAVRLEALEGIRPVIFVPSQLGFTAAARAALPATVPHADAAFNASRTALLVHALTRTPALLFDATEDRLHQEYRSPAMPDTAKLLATLREEGIAAVVSGSGPTVLALVADDDHLLAEAENLCPEGWWSRSLDVAAEGARILTVEHAEGDPVAAGLPG
ncbi:homoserine kinase [Luedemannella flava]|uniref:Homoserine kinase n=1 Tax=Luedemannella flava TaxID=349316 RepID=A0ABP4YNI4_9ACTN